MKKLSITTVIFLVSLFITAQTAPPNLVKIGVITGKVVDKTTQHPVSYATVAVKSLPDNGTVTGAITQEDGGFELKGIPEGKFAVEVQYIGYKIYRQEVTISKENRNVRLGTILLEEEVAELKGVDVVAERSTIEQKIDRKVITVGKDLTTSGATAADIMNNIPSVSVDQQTGNVSLRGNENVRVMVDGKLSNVPVDQLLKQIPSTSIKSIELITNPSAKYNPEGMSGIINIILHKNANIGFNGNITVGLNEDINAKFNSALDLNYRSGKFNLYGNYGNNVGKYSNHGHIIREIENSEQFFNFLDNNKSHLFKAGLDFYLDDKNTLSFFTNQNIYDGKTNGLTRLVFYDDTSANFAQNAFNKSHNTSEQYNFDYKRNLGKEGHTIELEADYNIFKDDNAFDFFFSGNTDLANYNDAVLTDRTQFISNLDYVNPLSDKAKLEMGLEARLFESDVEYSSTGTSYNPETESYEPTPDRAFLYKMDIYSGYATYGKTFEKWSYQIGARLEHVNITADLNDERAFTDTYTQVYPSGFLTYTPVEKDQYQLSVSRRVDRPGLEQVNPFREWSTPQISSIGNPELVPQFTNSVEANYTRRLKGGSITAGVFYRFIEDEINRAVYINRVETEKIDLTFDNFDRSSAYGVELSSNYRPTKWWNFNAGFDLFSQEQRSVTERSTSLDNEITEDEIIEEEVAVNNTAWNLRINNNFKVTKHLTLSLFGLYRSRALGVQFERLPMYFVNTGARYNFADNKGTISLNFSDIFNTMYFGFEGERPYRQEGDFHWESRNVYLGLSYRFGSSKDRALSRKQRDDNTKQNGGGIL